MLVEHDPFGLREQMRHAAIEMPRAGCFISEFTTYCEQQKMKRHCKKNVKKPLANCHEDHVLSAVVYKTCGEISF